MTITYRPPPLTSKIIDVLKKQDLITGISPPHPLHIVLYPMMYRALPCFMISYSSTANSFFPRRSVPVVEVSFIQEEAGG